MPSLALASKAGFSFCEISSVVMVDSSDFNILNLEPGIVDVISMYGYSSNFNVGKLM